MKRTLKVLALVLVVAMLAVAGIITAVFADTAPSVDLINITTTGEVDVYSYEDIPAAIAAIQSYNTSNVVVKNAKLVVKGAFAEESLAIDIANTKLEKLEIVFDNATYHVTKGADGVGVSVKVADNQALTITNGVFTAENTKDKEMNGSNPVLNADGTLKYEYAGVETLVDITTGTAASSVTLNNVTLNGVVAGNASGFDSIINVATGTVNITGATKVISSNMDNEAAFAELGTEPTAAQVAEAKRSSAIILGSAAVMNIDLAEGGQISGPVEYDNAAKLTTGNVGAYNILLVGDDLTGANIVFGTAINKTYDNKATEAVEATSTLADTGLEFVAVTGGYRVAPITKLDKAETTDAGSIGFTVNGLGYLFGYSEITLTVDLPDADADPAEDWDYSIAQTSGTAVEGRAATLSFAVSAAGQYVITHKDTSNNIRMYVVTAGDDKKATISVSTVVDGEWTIDAAPEVLTVPVNAVVDQFIGANHYSFTNTFTSALKVQRYDGRYALGVLTVQFKGFTHTFANKTYTYEELVAGKTENQNFGTLNGYSIAPVYTYTGDLGIALTPKDGGYENLPTITFEFVQNNAKVAAVPEGMVILKANADKDAAKITINKASFSNFDSIPDISGVFKNEAYTLDSTAEDVITEINGQVITYAYTTLKADGTWNEYSEKTSAVDFIAFINSTDALDRVNAGTTSIKYKMYAAHHTDSAERTFTVDIKPFDISTLDLGTLTDSTYTGSELTGSLNAMTFISGDALFVEQIITCDTHTDVATCPAGCTTPTHTELNDYSILPGADGKPSNVQTEATDTTVDGVTYEAGYKIIKIRGNGNYTGENTLKWRVARVVNPTLDVINGYDEDANTYAPVWKLTSDQSAGWAYKDAFALAAGANKIVIGYNANFNSKIFFTMKDISFQYTTTYTVDVDTNEVKWGTFTDVPVDANGSWTLAPGTYFIRFKVAATDSHTGLDWTYPVEHTVTPAAHSYANTANDTTFDFGKLTFNGVEQKIPVANVTKDGETITSVDPVLPTGKIFAEDPIGLSAEVVSGKDVGDSCTATITYTFANYVSATVTYKFEILPLEVKIKMDGWDKTAAFEYDTTAQGGGYTVWYVKDGKDVQLTAAELAANPVLKDSIEATKYVKPGETAGADNVLNNYLKNATEIVDGKENVKTDSLYVNGNSKNNYKVIEYVKGNVRIDPAIIEVTLEGSGYTGTYNGQEHVYTLTLGGKDIQAQAKGSDIVSLKNDTTIIRGVDVDSKRITADLLELNCYDSNNCSVSDCYKLVFTNVGQDGLSNVWFKIVEREITLTIGDDLIKDIAYGTAVDTVAEKLAALTAGDKYITVTAGANQLVSGHSISTVSTDGAVKSEYKLTSFGAVKAWIDASEIKIMSGSIDVTANYKFTDATGSFVVKTKSLVDLFDGQENFISFTWDQNPLRYTGEALLPTLTGLSILGEAIPIDGVLYGNAAFEDLDITNAGTKSIVLEIYAGPYTFDYDDIKAWLALADKEEALTEEEEANLAKAQALLDVMTVKYTIRPYNVNITLPLNLKSEYTWTPNGAPAEFSIPVTLEDGRNVVAELYWAGKVGTGYEAIAWGVSGDTNGNYVVNCDESHEYSILPPEGVVFEFKNLSATVGTEYALNFKINAHLLEMYNFEVIFKYGDYVSDPITSLDGIKKVIATDSADSIYVFTFDQIAPKDLEKDVEIILAIPGLGEIHAAYSVSDYCYGQLSHFKGTTNSYRAIFVALLRYGAEAQKYNAYINKTTIDDEDLVTYRLDTDEEYAEYKNMDISKDTTPAYVPYDKAKDFTVYKTGILTNQNIQVIVNSGATIRYAITLDDSVVIDEDNVLAISVAGGNTYYSSSDDENALILSTDVVNGKTRYYVVVDVAFVNAVDAGASEFTVQLNGEDVAKLEYSIENYAAAVTEAQDPAASVAQALVDFGYQFWLKNN